MSAGVRLAPRLMRWPARWPAAVARAAAGMHRWMGLAAASKSVAHRVSPRWRRCGMQGTRAARRRRPSRANLMASRRKCPAREEWGGWGGCEHSAGRGTARLRGGLRGGWRGGSRGGWLGVAAASRAAHRPRRNSFRYESEWRGGREPSRANEMAISDNSRTSDIEA